jgi:hypothetical protein
VFALGYVRQHRGGNRANVLHWHRRLPRPDSWRVKGHELMAHRPIAAIDPGVDLAHGRSALVLDCVVRRDSDETRGLALAALVNWIRAVTRARVTEYHVRVLRWLRTHPPSDSTKVSYELSEECSPEQVCGRNIGEVGVPTREVEGREHIREPTRQDGLTECRSGVLLDTFA